MHNYELSTVDYCFRNSLLMFSLGLCSRFNPTWPISDNGKVSMNARLTLKENDMNQYWWGILFTTCPELIRTWVRYVQLFLNWSCPSDTIISSEVLSDDWLQIIAVETSDLFCLPPPHPSRIITELTFFYISELIFITSLYIFIFIVPYIHYALRRTFFLHYCNVPYKNI